MESSSKVPLFYNVGEEAEWLNPRVTWNYSNEDWVGRMSRVAFSVRFGLVAAKRSKPLVSKYCMGMSVRLKHDIL